MQDIVREVDPQQGLPPSVEQRASQMQPPPLKNAIFYYVLPPSLRTASDELPFANDVAP